MYGVRGEKDLEESTLDHLKGYEGSVPVRIGNGAYNQRQNDVFGAVLDSVYLHSKQRDHIPERLWPVLIDQVKCAAAVWRNPDQGIWEARGEPQHYVSSKLMCWVALDRGARLAERRGNEDHAEEFQGIADEIREDILANGLDSRGVFRQHYDTDALDASTLLVPLLRFLPPDDERVIATVCAIRDELTENGLVLRYRTEETDDGLSGKEGTFLICSFWLVSALSEIGEDREAEHLCERLLVLLLAARAIRRGARGLERTPPRQLPAGVHPPGADQRGHARDRGAAAELSVCRAGRAASGAAQYPGSPGSSTRATSPSSKTFGSTGCTSRPRACSSSSCDRAEAVELFEVLDRGEDEHELAFAVCLQRCLGREPAEVDHLLAVDLRLLAGGQRGEEEVRVEADLHLRRRDPARELDERVGVFELDRCLLAQLADRGGAMGAIAVALVGIDGASGKHPHAAHEARLGRAPHEQHLEQVVALRAAGSRSPPGAARRPGPGCTPRRSSRRAALRARRRLAGRSPRASSSADPTCR